MSKLSYIILAVVFGFIGTALRIVAYQNTPEHNVPEWVYNLDSIAYALETLWPYLLSIALSKYLPHIKIIHLVKFPAVTYCYIAFFDAGKEVVGMNVDGGWGEIFVFCMGLFTILLFQYYVYRYNTTK